MTLITKAAYAKSRASRGLPGGTKPGVQRAVESGRLTLVNGMVDADTADQQWDARTSRTQQRSVNATSCKPAPKLEPGAGNGGEKVETKNEAETRKEIALASLRELELKRETGELLDRSEVVQTWGSLIVAARSKILSIAPNLAQKVAVESDPVECEQILKADLYGFLSELQGYRPDAA